LPTATKTNDRMEAVIVPIAIAIIGGPMMWLLHRLDRRNTDQHDQSMKILTEVRDDIKIVNRRLNKHIDWHAEKE